MRVASGFVGVVLVVGMSWGGAWAQATGTPRPVSTPAAAPVAVAAPAAAKAPEVEIRRPEGPIQPMQTFYLKNASGYRDLNAISNILRSLLPKGSEIVGVDSQDAIIVSGTPEELALAQKVINEVDRPDDPALSVKTYFLNHIGQPNDGNEILTALRNILPPDVKLYLVPSQNAIVLRATIEQHALVQKLIGELDRAKKSYRLTYTVTQTDDGKRVGVEHFTMVVANGSSVTLKQGSRVPIATGSSGTTATPTTTQTQIQYQDIGMTFYATLTEMSGGAQLKSKVEASSVADENASPINGRDPVIRQTNLEGTSLLTLGKPTLLGSADVAGSTRHLDVEAMVEEVK